MTVQAKSNPMETTPERELIVARIRRYGGSSCDALLDPVCRIFTISAVDGLIGYRVEHGCAVVYGDPVCAKADIPALSLAFHAYCLKQGWRVIYLLASESFTKWALQNICRTSIEYGAEFVIDPHADPRELHGEEASLVRRKVRKAIHEGVSVEEYIPSDAAIEQALEQVGRSWLIGRHRPQAYISHVRLFDDRLGKRWFYARKEDKFVGMVVLNRVEARQGWHMNHLMPTKEAPGGTPELLVTTVLEKLKGEGCHYVSFGGVPAKDFGEITGLGTFSKLIARLCYKIAHSILHLDGHRKFWGKFHPEAERSFLLFSQPRISPRDIAGLLRAVNMTF